MTQDGLDQARRKMADAGLSPAAIDVFSYYYEQLRNGATGLIAEDSIDSLPQPARLSDVSVDAEAAREALGRTVIIKLNGGLGTSMGMAQAKSLLPVHDGRSFLDIICEQVRHARSSFGVRLPLLFMDSFRTSADTLAALAAHSDLAVDGLPWDFIQNQVPKLRTDRLTPVTWAADPSLEWCPPGHGDLYTALLETGILELLLEQGYRYAMVNNADNLGATPDPQLAGWYAATGAPFAIEVCRRTAADRKGGHLALRRADSRIILRESAQTAAQDMDAFTDESRHAFFNTNSLWFDLARLDKVLRETNGVLGLPLIRNIKTVDPTDPSSPEVYQVETAMGAAIEVFEGAQAIEVGRERFLPVKTTNDLLLLRSDVYDVGADGSVRREAEAAPLIDLDTRFYRTIADFDQRFPAGAPSLRTARSLSVAGDWTFEADVVCEGDAELQDAGTPSTVRQGTRLR